jgi:hypothetical protein
MADVKGTRVYWRASNTGAAASPQQILKNSGYISVVLQAVQYKAGGNLWQRLFGGNDKITVSTQVAWQSASDAKTVAAIQDFRKVSVPSTNSLAIGRNVVLKVPATADGIELKVSISAVQDDNLGRTLQLLNSDEFKQPLQLAPVAVGQAVAIASLVKKAFTDTDPADMLSASYPGIISDEASPDPVENNRLVQGYIILMVKQDDEDRIDYDPAQISVTGNGLMVNGRAIPNTYMVYNVTFDTWRGRDISANWSKKFEQASSKADELVFGGQDQHPAIVAAAYDLLKSGYALLDDDVNYTTAEKVNLKKAAYLEIQGKINSNAAGGGGQRGLLPGLFDFDVRGDVAAYASELADSGRALAFNVRLDDSAPSLGSGPTRGVEPALVARGFTPEDLAALRPYVVSMRQGRWDTDGIFNSTQSDVQALFFEHAEAALQRLAPGKKLKFIVYAHGGLVPEDHGLAQAKAHIEWLKASADDGIYPLYFVWKTGLGETIANLLGLAKGATTREFITDPIIAALVRGLGGEKIWTDMKEDARKAVLPDSVATFVAQQMKLFVDKHPDRIELHAVGHSAGSVFHCHYIPASTAAGNPAFKTTSFMAPAVRVDTFLSHLTSDDGAGGHSLNADVGHFAILTMKRDFELSDDCAKIYRQSLLYLIYHALEDVDKTPLLGLEESIRSDTRLLKLMGLGAAPSPNADAVWSPTQLTDGPLASRAIHHGDFSSDQASLDSILCRVLEVTNLPAERKFPSSRALDDIWDIWGASAASVGSSAPATLVLPPASAALPKSSSASPGSGLPTQAATDSSTGRSSNNRRALCVGINRYPSPNTLSGCVSDANEWANTLQSVGFETKLLLDEAATHAALTAELEKLVSSSQAGDVIVFQYAGHGTLLTGNTGRTIDGKENAMVPIDFSLQQADLLMDFDVKAIFDRLPDGVNLTCFIDCCHSGTNLRALGPPGLRARQITLTPEQTAAALLRVRPPPRTQTRGVTPEGTVNLRSVSFAACQDNEVAFESGNHGEFTLRALQTLAKGVDGVTNQAFSEAVTAAFGSSPNQHPKLDSADRNLAMLLLQPYPQSQSGGPVRTGRSRRGL